jgi:hypothetical protein
VLRVSQRRATGGRFIIFGINKSGCSAALSFITFTTSSEVGIEDKKEVKIGQRSI